MKNKGFTLLEMIVVMSIVSIIFILSISNVSKVIKNVEEKGCQALLKVVDSASLQFQLEYEEKPSSIEDLVNAGYLSEKQIYCSNERPIILGEKGAYVSQ